MSLATPMASAQGPPTFEREIRDVGGGLTAVPLDRHVYEAAREDLGDLRVRDGQGETVAYVVDREGDTEDTMAPRWSRAFVDDPRETWLTLELGARYQPFVGFVLEVADERFRRSVQVEAREEPVVRHSDVLAPRDTWRWLGVGVVFRRGERDDLQEGLRVDVVGRARVVRLRIQDRDDRPLRITGVAAVVPRERLLFVSEDGASYSLTYGSPGLRAPSHDLSQTLGDDPSARGAVLGPPLQKRVEADVPPWTERHPTLLWVGLLVVVAALGAVTWQALRSA